MLTLTLRCQPEGRIRADAIAADRLAGLSREEIGALLLWPSRGGSGTSRRAGVGLGEVFRIEGKPGSDVRVLGELDRVDGLGTRMGSGTLTIDGNAGRDVGREMTGGRINITGNVAERAGMAMAGGLIAAAGSAGASVGGALPGGSRGMTGGEIVVRGDAGPEAGSRARRGLIVIGGDTEDGAGRSMIAGTLVIVGRAKGGVGEWNKRGSIIAIGGAAVPVGYRYACSYAPEYLRLLFRHAAQLGVPVEAGVSSGRFARHCGDLALLGKGELLLWTAS